ncbi:MAG: hypothetical protein WC781_05650 [Candidatus Pacearchaeota archaeon]|jgi:DNA-binding CsgD family transcriptional regulator
MIDVLLKGKIKSLTLKGFSKEEILKLLGISEEQFKENETEKIIGDINTETSEYYSELQKDLSKLVITELNNEGNRDSNVILNAIKLQAGLQEKKLFLGRKGETKISKDYIYERDKEVKKLKDNGKTDKQISEELNLDILSVRQAIDRNDLNIPEEIKERLSPSVITETKGLDKKRRMEILQQAVDENLKRNDIRKMVNEIKNESR